MAILKWIDKEGGECWRDTNDLPANTPLLLQKVADQIDQGENVAATQATWAALTPAQKDEAQRKSVLILCKVCRLLVGRLEAS